LFISQGADIKRCHSDFEIDNLKDQKMKKVAFVLSLALSATAAVAGANAGTGKATTLMIKELPDLLGKDGMVEVVDFAPGEDSQPHRHNADLFVYVLEGTIVTQVKGEAPKSLTAGDVFYESPTDVHVVSRNASTTEPAKLLVFYVKDKGAPPTVLVQHDQ
jgi:quercetin dioxygenase-like cupin family protein